MSSLLFSPDLEWLSPRGGANFSQHILPEAQHLLGPHKDCSSGDTGHPAAVTWEHPRFPQDYKQLSFGRKRAQTQQRPHCLRGISTWTSGQFQLSRSNTNTAFAPQPTPDAPPISHLGTRPHPIPGRFPLHHPPLSSRRPRLSQLRPSLLPGLPEQFLAQSVPVYQLTQCPWGGPLGSRALPLPLACSEP